MPIVLIVKELSFAWVFDSFLRRFKQKIGIKKDRISGRGAALYKHGLDSLRSSRKSA